MKSPLRVISNQAGVILPVVIAITLILSAIGVAVADMVVSDIKATTQQQRQLKALNVAEAGINYYLWHLSHNPIDYQDGGSTPTSPPYGPYVHDYFDDNGIKIGTYTLTVTPPASGSTVTTVKSVGQVSGLKGTRTIQAQLGIPSFANYVLLTNTEVWFGPGEDTTGPVHSNVGVHFDAINNGTVSSARATYVPTAPFGGNGVTTHNGVWGNGGPTAQWQFPVPPIDFNSVTANLSDLQTQAQANGVFLASLGAFNVSRGYYLKLKNNNTIDIYRVTNESAAGITTTFVRNQAAPPNGVLFAADNVWIDGTYNGRLTVVSARLPDVSSTNTTIKVINNLTYTAKDGSAAIGLIAQKDVQVTRYAPNNLEIDAALLAQKGQVYFPFVSGVIKTNLNFYGALATNDTWTWSWVNGSGTITSGYPTSTNTFDTHLTFAPPPSYPTTGAFTILNWREMLTGP